jgi:alpha-beta hydrolase superfamily lysophospholipase
MMLTGLDRLRAGEAAVTTRTRRLLVMTVSAVLVSVAPALREGRAQPAENAPNWYDGLVFRDPSFAFELIRVLGYAYSGGADIGESIGTARAIRDGDIHSWYQAWADIADRMYGLAETMRREGHLVSARGAYFRAANYYRAAGFYMDADGDRPKSVAASTKAVDAFAKGIASLPAVTPVRIPYGTTTLPGYFIRSAVRRAPLLIVNTGFDGTAEELYFEVGQAAQERGYNVLLFEGPGQGRVLRDQKLPFRHDWERVVSPAIDFARALPGVDRDRIALMGISMGGYLAPRACAFDRRIKACVANGGILSLSRALPRELADLLEEDPREFDRVLAGEMGKAVSTYWFFQHGMWAFGAKSPAGFALALRRYTLEDVAKQITVPTLVVESEADAFFKGQAQAVYDLLRAPKALLRFTAAEGAQAHCQMGAIAISNEKIFNWLDRILRVTGDGSR